MLGTENMGIPISLFQLNNIIGSATLVQNMVVDIGVSGKWGPKRAHEPVGRQNI